MSILKNKTHGILEVLMNERGHRRYFVTDGRLYGSYGSNHTSNHYYDSISVYEELVMTPFSIYIIDRTDTVIGLF